MTNGDLYFETNLQISQPGGNHSVLESPCSYLCAL